MDYREQTYYLPDGTSVSWFSPLECVWDSQQVKWILVYLDLILTGYWPDSDEDFRIDQRSWRAPGETIRLNGIEVRARLDKTGRDGLLCLTFYHGGVSQDRLARYERMPVEEVGERISQVIRYISGWRRKWIKKGNRKGLTYEEFIQHKKHKEVKDD